MAVTARQLLLREEEGQYEAEGEQRGQVAEDRCQCLLVGEDDGVLNAVRQGLDEGRGQRVGGPQDLGVGRREPGAELVGETVGEQGADRGGAQRGAGEARRLLEAAELVRFTPATLTDVDALVERLGRIRRLGHSVTRGELDPDVVGIAAPIMDQNRRVTAAVSVAALASRVYPKAETELAQKAQATAGEITERLSLTAA